MGVVGGSGFNGEIWYYTAADSMLVGTAESTASSLLASNLYDGMYVLIYITILIHDRGLSQVRGKLHFPVQHTYV